MSVELFARLSDQRVRSTPMGINREVAEKIIEAENRCDVEAVASLYAEDASYVDPSGTTRGRAAIAELFRGFFEAFPDALRTIERSVEEGDWVAFEGVFTATHTGPFPAAAAIVPATGRRVELPFMAIGETRDGRVVYARLYFDQLEMMMQLGLMPQPPGQ